MSQSDLRSLIEQLRPIATMLNEMGFTCDEAVTLMNSIRIEEALKVECTSVKEVAALLDRSPRCIQLHKSKAKAEEIAKSFEGRNRKSKYVSIMEVVPPGRPMTVGDIAKVLRWDEDVTKVFVLGGERKGYLRKIANTVPAQYEHTGVPHVRPEPKTVEQRLSRAERALRILRSSTREPLTRDVRLSASGARYIEDCLSVDNASAEPTFVVASCRDRESTDRLAPNELASDTFGIVVTFGENDCEPGEIDHAHRCVLRYIAGGRDMVVPTNGFFDKTAMTEFYGGDLEIIDQAFSRLLDGAIAMGGEEQKSFRLTITFACLEPSPL